MTSGSLSPSSLPEIRLAGFLQSGLGLGESARLVGQSLRAAGVPVLTHAWKKSDIDKVDFEVNGTEFHSKPDEKERAPGISLLCLNGEHLSSFTGGAGQDLITGNYVISIWFWELPELSPRSRAGFKYVDEVWAATPFIRDALIKHSGDIPVHVFDHPVRVPAGDQERARSRFPFDGRFVFLFSFDYHSCVKRKNPDGCCEAFARAFPNPSPDGPLCVIKSINASLHPVPDIVLRRRWAHRRDIIFMDEFLTTEDRDLLAWRADACVSLHRSEGLGLTMMEAMSIGKPCIATGYSGNLAFMMPEHTWLIPFKPVKVGPGSMHYPAEQIWAEPDCDAAADAMRDVFSGGPEVRRKAEAGAAHVREHHDATTCGHRMADMLANAANKTPRLRKAAGSPRAEAFTMLAKLREDEKKDIPAASSWLKLPQAVKKIQNVTRRTARDERKAMSLILASCKQQEERHRNQIDALQRHIEKLSNEISQIVSLLPPV